MSPARSFASDADAAAPIAVELCDGSVQSATNPNLKVGVGFRDLKDVDAVHVEFDIVLLDGSGNSVDTRTVSIDGTFAPNVLILPRRASITDSLLTQPEYPDSPAWNVADHFGSGVERVRCELHAAKFSDGSAWERPKP